MILAMSTTTSRTADGATIALVGSGEYLEHSRAVDEHLLGLLDVGGRPPRVACLPTAAASEGEAVWSDWSRRGVAWFRSLGADSVAVDVIDRDSADEPGLVADIESADLVYLSGGKPTLLHQVLDGSAAWRAIEAVLARGGILAGCSAGAMVQGERIAGLRGGSHATPGFGLLPGAIVLPHFDEYPSMIGAAVSRLVGRGLSVVGVDGGTALVRHEGRLRAVGRGSVTVWGPLGHHRFSDEDLPDGAIGPT